MLWSQQVGAVDAVEAMDYVGAGETGLDALRDKRQPVIYPFNRGPGRGGFVAPKDPYA